MATTAGRVFPFSSPYGINHYEITPQEQLPNMGHTKIFFAKYEKKCDGT
jgi:hypothetical protein